MTNRVTVHLVDLFVADAGYQGADVCCVSRDVEDFADCDWPVVVKVKPHVTDEQLVRHLLYLAATIEPPRGA